MPAGAVGLFAWDLTGCVPARSPGGQKPCIDRDIEKQAVG